MSFLARLRPPQASRFTAAGLGATAALATALLPALTPQLPAGVGLPAAQASAGTCQSLLEYRWSDAKGYRKLRCFYTETTPLKRSEYYLVLGPKDRNTAILKLSITIPASFDVQINPRQVKLCQMSEGGMTTRTRCLKEAKNGRAIEIFPATPVPDAGSIGVYMNLFNPFNAGMYQFNALAQAPGDVPIAGYLGSWLIQIEPN